MGEPTLIRMLFSDLPAAASAVLCLALAAALVRKPSKLLLSFFLFYLLSVLHLAGAYIYPLVLKSGQYRGLGRAAEIGLAIARLRYLFLILFSQSLHRFRATRALTALMSALVLAGAACPFFVYSIIPNLMEIAVVLYSFGYWLTAYLLRAKLALSPRREGLLKAMLASSGFFLIGIVLGLAAQIPEASVYVSLLAVDFHPFYVACVGAVMAAWAARDVLEPAAGRGGAGTGSLDFRGLPVTRREGEVIALILSGETNASIADRLFISESTVKKHVNNIFRKLGISSRWELVKLTGGILPKE